MNSTKHCSQCGEIGHNKKTCKNKRNPVDTPKIEEAPCVKNNIEDEMKSLTDRMETLKELLRQQKEEEERKKREEEEERRRYFNTRGDPIRFLFGGRFNPGSWTAEWRLLKLAYETGTANFVYFANSHSSRGELEPHDTICVRYIDDTSSYSYELVYHIYFKIMPDGKKFYTHITNLDATRNPKVVAIWKIE